MRAGLPNGFRGDNSRSVCAAPDASNSVRAGIHASLDQRTLVDATADSPQVRLRSAVEATRLNYGLTDRDVAEVVRATVALSARGVCVPGAFLTAALDRAAAESPAARAFDLVTVVNFPTGDHPLAAVEAAATAAAGAGADHVDVVVPGALIDDHDWRGIASFIRAVRAAAVRETGGRNVLVKAILETATWDTDRIRGAALAAIEGGAAWLKTSTGFHPAGGATLPAVELLRAVAPETVGVKASGGIRTRADALAMLDAGADRIGTSAEKAILEPASA